MGKFVTVGLVWIFLFAAAEGGAWFSLKAWFAGHPSQNESVNEYWRRGHPLFTNNDDLRAKELTYVMDSHLAYVLHPGIDYKYDHRGTLEVLHVDDAGFIHNGDADANPRLGSLSPDKVYRIVFFGGSTMAGQNSGDNAHTIPAYFERMVRQEWPDASVQVINAGIFGYESTSERLRYGLKFRRQHPGMVIFLDGYNDAAVPMQFPDWQPHRSIIGLTQKDYLAMLSPAKSFLTWTANLLRFPEPLATLALARRLRDRIIMPSGKNPPTFYYPQATEVFEDNLEAIAVDVAALGGRAIFALQPALPLGNKPLTGDEKKLLGSLESDTGFPQMLSRYYQDFVPLWPRLRQGHGSDAIRFVDLTSAFDDLDAHVYDDIVHYNAPGNERLAARLFVTARDGIAADLKARGLGRSK